MSSVIVVIEACVVPFCIVVMFATVANNALPLEAGYGDGEIGVGNIGDATVNMFVVLTTENYPDILHHTLIIANGGTSKDYGDNSKIPQGGLVYMWPIFFVVFLMFGLFVLANLMLAIIWDVYKAEYRKKALLSRSKEREGLLTAFMTLDYDRTGDFKREVWHPFMRALQPHLNFHEADLMFDMLDVSGNGTIGPHEFIKLNDLVTMYSQTPLASIRSDEAGVLTAALRQLVSSWHFETVISGSIVLCSIILMLQNPFIGSKKAHIFTNFFLIVFLIEVLMRTAAFGIRSLFSDWSKGFDTLVILGAFIGFVVIIANPDIPNTKNVVKIQSLLIFRMTRLFMPGSSIMANRYHLLVTTLVATIPACCGLMSTLALIMYSYAIIGVECFYGVLGDDHPVENFNSFGHAMLALFQCLMVNNWNDLLTGCMGPIAEKRGAFIGVYGPSAYFLSFLGLEVVIVANVIAAVFLTVFNLNQDRLANKTAVNNEGIKNAGEKAGMVWQTDVQRLMLEAIIEEEREDVEREEQDTLLRLWRASRPAIMQGETEEERRERDRVVEQDFVTGREKLVTEVRKSLGDDAEPDPTDERGLYLREAHARLYNEELRAPRHWHDVEL